MRVTKFDRVVWWNCTRAAAGRWGPGTPGPYSATLVEQALKARYTGGMNPSPANRYRVVVGRPALWPPRTFAVLYNFMSCHCRGRHPRRPAEGSRPLPTNRSKTGLRIKKAHRPQSGAVRKISLCYARLTPAGACRPRPAFPSGPRPRRGPCPWW